MAQGWRHFPYATIYAVHDGDTLEVEVDAGFGAYHRVAVRLFGISAPELTGSEKEMGKQALAAVRQFELHSCMLWTWKQSFARYVGKVVLPGGKDLARQVLTLGVARAWDGVTVRPAFDPWPNADIDQELALYDRIASKAGIG